MDLTILNPKIQHFISANVGTDLAKLALSKNPFPEIEWVQIIRQIAAKTKSQDKLPTWFKTPGVIYPSKISLEQTSSEQTAQYKSELVDGDIIDLTGGFGIDDYYFSKTCNQVVHCEISTELSEICRHNFEKLGAGNVECIAGDSRQILTTLQRKFDWMFIDPSRRDDEKGKVFMLQDCLPNVPENLGFYFSFTQNILIKTAPLLDISAGLSELKNVKSIHIIAVRNEVKELLWELEKTHHGAIALKTINFSSGKTEKFEFELGEIANANYGLPLEYLYEPNAAIMKSGGFDKIGLAFNVEKLHRHSHLYTSGALVDFPGRIFRIEKTLAYTKSNMQQIPKRSNITTRNFPDSVETIRKKWKISDGGNSFCFFTTDKNDNKIVLICTKINFL